MELQAVVARIRILMGQLFMTGQQSGQSQADPGARPSKYGGGVGIGLVLIVMPCVALFWILTQPSDLLTVTLPVLTILGIMILFGSLALVSTLFKRLSLSDRSQPLALPEGSIRAVIALSLIVLFAIISIMLYQTDAKPYVLPGVSAVSLAEMLKSKSINPVAVIPEACGKPEKPSQNCEPNEQRFTIHIRPTPAQESIDLAKQLLILIGTLMTSVTSFYFAARTTEISRKAEASAVTVAEEKTDLARDESHTDGCGTPVDNPTKDEELPPSRGGVSA